MKCVSECVRMYRAPSRRERERWHALRLLARSWSAAQTADAHSEQLPELPAPFGLFVLKRPKKRLLKAKAAVREAFVASYATLWLEAQANHREPLVVTWDNSPAHRGEAIRSYLSTPDLNLVLVALPAYSPDFNGDEAIWDWA